MLIFLFQFEIMQYLCHKMSPGLHSPDFLPDFTAGEVKADVNH